MVERYITGEGLRAEALFFRMQGMVRCMCVQRVRPEHRVPELDIHLEPISDFFQTS